MDIKQVKAAIRRGGSIREAAKILGKSYTAVQWFIARSGYEVVKKAELRRKRRKVS